MSNDQRGAYLALVIAAFVTLDARTSPFTITFVAILPIVLVAYHLLGRPSIIIAYLAGGGLIERMTTFPAGGWTDYSDSLRAVSESTATMLAGRNPYDHRYLMTVAPYTSSVYTPPMFLLHAPGQWLLGLSGAMLTQVAGAAIVMAILAWLALRSSSAIGLPILALYCCLPFIVFLTTNGTNDTAVGAAVLVGAVILGRALERPSTLRLVLAGAALAFTFGAKQFAWPVAIVLLAYAWRRAGWRTAVMLGVSGALTFLLVSLPFIAMDPGRFESAMVGVVLHSKVIFGWNIWDAIQASGIALPADTLPVTVGATLIALAVACFVRYRSFGEAALGGIAVAFVLLVTTRWTSASYLPLFAPLALAAPILDALRVRTSHYADRDSGPAHSPSATEAAIHAR